MSLLIVPEERRILLEGLNLKTSTNDIERFFTKWGPLSECIVMFDKNTGRSRGYGFICFVWDHHCEQCLEAQPYVIDGVQITMRPIKDVSSNPIVKYVSTRKILVSFLGAELSIDEIEEYFSKFGIVHVDYAVDSRTEKPLYFAYVTFDEVESCVSCTAIGEHHIDGHRVFIRKVIRREDLKKAEQMERVRAAREARIQEELEEEAEKRRRLLHRKLREKYATELALLRPPPPPPPPQPSSAGQPCSSSQITVEESMPSTSSSNWVPLLPNDGFQENASYLAGYGNQRQQQHEHRPSFSGITRSEQSVGIVGTSSSSSSQWIPLPSSNVPEPSDVVRRYSTPNDEPYKSLS